MHSSYQSAPVEARHGISVVPTIQTGVSLMAASPSRPTATRRPGTEGENYQRGLAVWNDGSMLRM